jgi:hypothetical protein
MNVLNMAFSLEKLAAAAAHATPDRRPLQAVSDPLDPGYRPEPVFATLDPHHCGLRRKQRSGREIGSVNDAVSRQYAFTRLCEGVRDIEPACRLCRDDHTRTRESGLGHASPRASDSTEQRTR